MLLHYNTAWKINLMSDSPWFDIERIFDLVSSDFPRNSTTIDGQWNLK